METSETATIAGWFAGRVPEGWFSGAPEVTLEGDQVVVVGALAPVALGTEVAAEVRAGAGRGRIARFRAETRRERIWIAREAEGLFNRNITWGATVGDLRETFTPGGSGRGGEKTAEGASVKIGRRLARGGLWAFGASRRGWFGGARPSDRRLF